MGTPADILKGPHPLHLHTAGCGAELDQGSSVYTLMPCRVLLASPQYRLWRHSQHPCTVWSCLYSTVGPVHTHSVQAPQAFAPKLEEPLLLTNPDVATKNVQLAANAGSSMEGTGRWCWPCKQYTADASAAAYRLTQ